MQAACIWRSSLLIATRLPVRAAVHATTTSSRTRCSETALFSTERAGRRRCSARSLKLAERARTSRSIADDIDDHAATQRDVYVDVTYVAGRSRSRPASITRRGTFNARRRRLIAERRPPSAAPLALSRRSRGRGSPAADCRARAARPRRFAVAPTNPASFTLPRLISHVQRSRRASAAPSSSSATRTSLDALTVAERGDDGALRRARRVAGAHHVERHLGGAAQRRLDGRRARRLLLVGAPSAAGRRATTASYASLSRSTSAVERGRERLQRAAARRRAPPTPPRLPVLRLRQAGHHRRAATRPRRRRAPRPIRRRASGR